MAVATARSRRARIVSLRKRSFAILQVRRLLLEVDRAERSGSVTPTGL